MNTHPVCGVYSLDNLISINGSSYQKNNIELGINNVMLNYAKQLDQEHITIKTSITDQIMENHSACDDEILELVDTNTLGADNIGNLLNYIDSQPSAQFNYADCFNWLRLNPSADTPDITSAGFGPYDNPWIILSDI
ncbi:hypothetical protein FACS1894218_5510 [Bacilli bacterium]|nr:hypothetical protein FACS1894218_5510 [Bacilli bacterium]